MDDQLEPLVRELAADLAEAWVVRTGAADGFTVWEDNGDAQSFADEAQGHFDRVSERIERELRWYGETRDLAGVIEALAPFADAAAVTAVITRLGAM